MTDEQIKHMVDRFLGWRLPESFSPDAGISFVPEFNVGFNARNGRPPERHNPIGTNLFDAQQAEEMVRYMIEGLPADRSTMSWKPYIRRHEGRWCLSLRDGISWTAQYGDNYATREEAFERAVVLWKGVQKWLRLERPSII